MNLRKTIVTVVGLAILISAFWFSGFLASLKEPPVVRPPEKIIKSVKATDVNLKPIKTEITAFGRVKTAQSLDMIAEVSGRMFRGSVSLMEGESFRKGQLLFRIDDEEARLNLQSQKSNFLRDIAGILPDLKIDFEGSYENWQKYFNAIDIEKPLPKIPEYESDKEKTFLATRDILSTYYTIKSQESRLDKYRFYAPFDGNIYNINLYSGSFVNPGSNIGRLIRSDQLELNVDVNAAEIEWIDKNAEITIKSDAGNFWLGKITRVGEFVNQNTQTIDVFISIVEGKADLYDGQFLKAVIPSRTIQNGMEVPRNIIYNQNEVFVVEDTVLNVKRVNIVKLNDETAIFTGLKEGEKLVMEPLINAYSGMRVNILDEKSKLEPESGFEVRDTSLSND